MHVLEIFEMYNYLKRLSKLDTLSRFVIVLIAIILVYIFIICLIFPLIVSQRLSEEYILSFSSAQHRHMNLISIVIAMIAGAIFAALINDDHNMKAIKGILSANDRKVIDVLEEVSEITQDSLMFRLEWSRAKISTILTNLEKRGLIQRRREGKTYVVFIPKK